MSCIFCNIVDKKIPAEIVAQDDELLAFKDAYPKAPLHYLIIPKKHVATMNDFNDDDAELIGKCLLLAKKLAKDSGVAEAGYRLVINCNKNGGQEVFHLHLHLMAGKPLPFPAA